jgi:hypothetical protein
VGGDAEGCESVVREFTHAFRLATGKIEPFAATFRETERFESLIGRAVI